MVAMNLKDIQLTPEEMTPILPDYPEQLKDTKRRLANQATLKCLKMVRDYYF